MGITQRKIGLDLVRVFATLFVLSVHFFANTYFYSTPVDGKNMYLQVFLRMFFLICVPLFMILTGYLQLNKDPNKDYYKKIYPILIVYLIYSLLAILTNVFIFKEEKSISEWIGAVLNFKADGYAWYVNMYIGLFLIAPFLNILYNNIQTKKQKQLLILVFLIITALPSFFNGKARGALYFPDFWIQLYPITYYFIGNYIREYQLKISKMVGVFCLVLITLIECWIEIHYVSDVFLGMAGSYSSLIVVMHATIFFLLFYDVNFNGGGLFLKLLSIISVLSLDIYLASYITDRIVYKYFLEHHFQSQQQFLYWFFPAVGTTFIFALTLSYIRYKFIKVR
ncbi:acyltransferase [Neobacillus sp. SAB-20_R2A]|uniref:acyltransferase n=1 Tax=Neobacillus sp. SAB-20_R2A TaxID=3120519 RepID=UPI003C6DF57A